MNPVGAKSGVTEYEAREGGLGGRGYSQDGEMMAS